MTPSDLRTARFVGCLVFTVLAVVALVRFDAAQPDPVSLVTALVYVLLAMVWRAR